MESNTLSARKIFNQSAIDKLKKKKRKKKKTKEGKRSSASSASASGSPDSGGAFGAQKPKTSTSCPSRLNNEQSKSCESPKEEIFAKVNECLRWPAHSSYFDNSFRSEIIGKFPDVGETEEEESERIAIYKMNRRKRYLAAQQALIIKYPDVSIYVSSSGSSSGHDTNEEGMRINATRKNGVTAAGLNSDKYFSNSDLSNGRINGDNAIARKNLLSV